MNPSENSRRFQSDNVGIRNIHRDGENHLIFARRNCADGQSLGVAHTDTEIKHWGGYAGEGTYCMDKWLDLSMGFTQGINNAVPLDSPFMASASTNSTPNLSFEWNPENGPRERYFLNLMQETTWVNNHLSTLEMKPSYLRMQESLPIRNGGNSQSMYPWNSQDMMTSIHNRGIQIAGSFPPTFLNECQQQIDQSSWMYAHGISQIGQDSNRLRPMIQKHQLFVNHLLQLEPHPTEIDFLGSPGMLRQQHSQPPTTGGLDENESGSSDVARQNLKGKAVMES